MSEVDRLSLALRGGGAALLGIVVNVVLVTVAQAVDIAPDFDPLSYPSVVFLSAVGAIGATVVYGLIARRRDDPDTLFVRIAAVVLVLSFLPDIGLLFNDETATVGGVIMLMIMHVVVAGACLRLIPREFSLSGEATVETPRNA